jgi:AraC-like DNA-binding protein
MPRAFLTSCGRLLARLRSAILRRLPRRRSVLRTFLFSSFVLVGVPIAISTIVYFQAWSVIRAEIDRANAEVLEQAMLAMDNRLQDVRSFGVSVIFNQTVNMLIQDPSVDAMRGHYYLVRQAINDLRNYSLTKWYVDDVGVYLRQSDSILTTNGVEEFDYYYGVENQHGLVFRKFASYGEWRSLLESEHAGDYVQLGAPGVGQDARPVLYLASLPIYRDREKYATLFFALNRARFFEPLAGMTPSGAGWGVLIDADDNVLFSTRALAGPLPVRFADMAGQTGITSVGAGRGAVTISWVSSGIKGWKFLSITPSSVYGERVRRTRNLIIVCLLASLVLGGVFAWVLSKRNYRPIDELVRRLGARGGLPSPDGRDEFGFIRDAMESAFGEKEKMSELLKEQSAKLRSHFLMKLMKGRIEDPAYIARAMETYAIPFRAGRFGVLLFSIVDPGSRNGAAGASPEVTREIARSLVSGIVEEAAGRRGRGCAAEVDGMLGCIVELSGGDPKEALGGLCAVAREAAELIQDTCGIVVTTAVSEPHETLLGIPVAYQEALSVMEYKRALGIDEVLSYDQIKAAPGSYDYPLETEHQLINSIKSGDFEAARGIVGGVFDRNFARGALSSDMTKCLVFDLVSTALKTMSDLGAPGDRGFLQDLDIAGSLLACETIAAMKDRMTEIIRQVCSYIQATRKSRQDHYIDKVTTYIDANYHDANLSVSSIAERFHITPTYLIRLFRERTGEGVFHYVTDVRMSRAKALLKEEGININDVASRVGYYSTTAFIRAFKKHEGVTPGSFKEMG